jgi:hypothetical protein
LETLACYEYDLSGFEPLLERIQDTEEKPTRMAMDMLDDVQKTTTKEALEKLFK